MTIAVAPCFDPFAPEFRCDPYPRYFQLVCDNPVHFSPAVSAWVLAGYAEVARGFRDLRLASQPRRYSVGLSGLAVQSQTSRVLSGMIGYLDPQIHTRIRGLIRQAMPQTFSKDLANLMAEQVQQRVAALQKLQEFDVVEDLALPLSIAAISHVLGVPVEDAEPLKQATTDFFRVFDPMTTPENRRKIDRAGMEFRDYFLRQIGLRRRSPGDDMLSRLVHAQHPEFRLSDNDIVSNCILIYTSGQQSPTNLISNSIRALSQFPDQWDVLLAGTRGIPAAIEEFLRFAGPSQFSARTLTADCEYGGAAIPRGEVVFLLNAAADRDPRRFTSPNALDLQRTDNAHLAFGAGVHHCMGSELTRQILSSLFQFFVENQLRLEVPPQRFEWKPYLATRGLEALRVRWG